MILAAGIGSRLMPLTADRPKALVSVAGRPLLLRLLEACASAGADEAVVVTGYLAKKLDSWIDTASLPLPVRTVYNPEHATINNAHSLWVARHALAGDDFIKLDGDLLISPGLLTRLIEAPSSTAAIVDMRGVLDPEAMKARLDPNGTIRAFGKWLPIAEASAESIGVERIGIANAPRLFDAIERIVHQEGNHSAYYEDVYHQLIQSDWQMGSVDTGGLPWTEIDNVADLERAHSVAEKIAESGA